MDPESLHQIRGRICEISPIPIADLREERGVRTSRLYVLTLDLLDRSFDLVSFSTDGLRNSSLSTLRTITDSRRLPRIGNKDRTSVVRPSDVRRMRSSRAQLRPPQTDRNDGSSNRDWD